MYCSPSLSCTGRMFIEGMNDSLSISTLTVPDKQKMVCHNKSRSSASSTLSYPV